MHTCLSDRTAVSSMGSQFPTSPFECRVHSVFRSALNISVTDHPILYSLVTSESQNHPAAAVIHFQTRQHIDFTDWPIEIGSLGQFNGRSLFLTGKSNISIDFSQAKQNAPEMMPQFNSNDPNVLLRIELAESILQTMQCHGRTGLRYSVFWNRNAAATSFAGRIGEAARELSTAISDTRYNRELVDSAIRKIVGLGEGLTPSGDDFLVGYLAALHCGKSGGWKQIAASILELELLKATNAISASFLILAASGLFSKPLFALAEAVGGSTDSDIRQSLDVLQGIGHSSGMDIAAGFLFGHRLVLK